MLGPRRVSHLLVVQVSHFFGKMMLGYRTWNYSKNGRLSIASTGGWFLPLTKFLSNSSPIPSDHDHIMSYHFFSPIPPPTLATHVFLLETKRWSLNHCSWKMILLFTGGETQKDPKKIKNRNNEPGLLFWTNVLWNIDMLINIYYIYIFKIICNVICTSLHV